MNKPESVLTDEEASTIAFGGGMPISKVRFIEGLVLTKLAEKAEPVAMMNPRETFIRDAFIWGGPDDRHPEYSQAVYTHPPTTAALLEKAHSEIVKLARLANIDHGENHIATQLLAAIEAHKKGTV